LERRAKRLSAPPFEIFLVCTFGASPWTPPVGLVEAAEEYRNRESAVIRVFWERRGKTYAVTKLQVEIRRPSKPLFTASFDETELSNGKLHEHEMRFPASAAEPFTFDISALIPNQSSAADHFIMPTASFRAKGVAGPVPEWLLY
jgi:hypothetical protein